MQRRALLTVWLLATEVSQSEESQQRHHYLLPETSSPSNVLTSDGVEIRSAGNCWFFYCKTITAATSEACRGVEFKAFQWPFIFSGWFQTTPSSSGGGAAEINKSKPLLVCLWHRNLAHINRFGGPLILGWNDFFFPGCWVLKPHSSAVWMRIISIAYCKQKKQFFTDLNLRLSQTQWVSQVPTTPSSPGGLWTIKINLSVWDSIIYVFSLCVILNERQICNTLYIHNVFSV